MFVNRWVIKGVVTANKNHLVTVWQVKWLGWHKLCANFFLKNVLPEIGR